MDCMNCLYQTFPRKVFEIESKQIWLASRDVTQINRNVGGFGDFIHFILNSLSQKYFMQFLFKSIYIIAEANKTLPKGTNLILSVLIIVWQLLTVYLSLTGSCNMRTNIADIILCLLHSSNPELARIRLSQNKTPRLHWILTIPPYSSSLSPAQYSDTRY